MVTTLELCRGTDARGVTKKMGQNSAFFAHVCVSNENVISLTMKILNVTDSAYYTQLRLFLRSATCQAEKGTY